MRCHCLRSAPFVFLLGLAACQPAPNASEAAADEAGSADEDGEDTSADSGSSSDGGSDGGSDTGEESGSESDGGMDEGGMDEGGEEAGETGDEGPPHEALLDELVGFGQTTTGGAGGPLVSVTTLADDGPGSLREAATTPGAAWIRFEVDGTIALEDDILVTSDKTLDGRGADVTVTGGGLYVQGGEGNVIVNNLKLRDTPDDIIRFFDGGTQMWIHHCDLSNGGDGAFDATEGVTEITVSYTHVFDHDKVMLTGAGSPEGDGDSMRWTAHHNYYDNVVQRLPGIRFGWAHTFNNLYEWKNGTAIWVRLGAQALVEHNIIAPQTGVGHKFVTSDEESKFRMVDNLEQPLEGDEIEFVESDPDGVFAASDYYDYTLEVADEGLADRIRTDAGWQDVPFPE